MFVPQSTIGYQKLSTSLSTMAGSSIERRLVRKLGVYIFYNFEIATNI